eukprot:5022505-Pyramimonas_sp.AAC.1
MPSQPASFFNARFVEAHWGRWQTKCICNDGPPPKNIYLFLHFGCHQGPCGYVATFASWTRGGTKRASR